jgi:hypothetical protein
MSEVTRAAGGGDTGAASAAESRDANSVAAPAENTHAGWC